MAGRGRGASRLVVERMVLACPSWLSVLPPLRRSAGPAKMRKGDLDSHGCLAHRILNPPEYPTEAAPAAKTRAFRRLARRSSGLCGWVQGTTGHNTPNPPARQARHGEGELFQLVKRHQPPGPFSKAAIRGTRHDVAAIRGRAGAAVCWFAVAWLAVAATLTTADRALELIALGPLHRGEWRAAARLVAWDVRTLRVATWLVVPGAAAHLPPALANQAEAEEGLGHIEGAGRLLDEATARARHLKPGDGAARGLRWRHGVFHREHAGQPS